MKRETTARKPERSYPLSKAACVTGLALAIALTIYSFALNPPTAAMQGTDKTMPTLSGDAAVEYLKKDESYGSLAAALDSIRDDDRVNSPDAQTKITASDGTPGSQLGITLAISGNTAVLGAASTDAEAVYVFEKNGSTWTQQQKLLSGHTRRDNFGVHSVAISGDTIIVGESLYSVDGAFPRTGAAVIFVRSGSSWAMQQRILAPDGREIDNFGYRVAIDGNTAVIAAPYTESPAFDQGSVYVYVRNGSSWSMQQKLTTTPTGFGDRLGFDTVGISGNTLIVGQPREDIGSRRSGGSIRLYSQRRLVVAAAEIDRSE